MNCRSKLAKSVFNAKKIFVLFRCKSESKGDFQEEIATMQTLYQYRTYSIDSSEESSGECLMSITNSQLD